MPYDDAIPSLTPDALAAIRQLYAQREYNPLADPTTSAASMPRLDQLLGQPSWSQQALEQSQRDQEAFKRGGVSEMLKDTEGTQDLAGGFGEGGIVGRTKAIKGAAEVAGEALPEFGATEHSARLKAAIDHDRQNGPPLQTHPDVSGSMNPLDEQPLLYKGKNPNEWTPQEYKEVGDIFGVKNLGPETPPQQFKYMNGATFNIPGGTEGKFTYYDMLRLKADGIDPSKIDPDLHTQLQHKILRSVTPEEVTPQRAWDGLIFGMTSPNNPLLPNQISQSRMRLRDPQMIDQLANMIPWKAGDDIPKALRNQYGELIANKFGLDAGAKGGLGTRGSMDYTRIAELAQMFQKNPDFFRKGADEPWNNFVERLSSQVPGLSMKTGSFGAVWQDPAHAAISAIDRHMAMEFEKTGGLFKDPVDRADFEQRAMERFNAAHPDRPVSNVDELRKASGSDHLIGKMLTEYVGKTGKPLLRTASGDLNPNVPEHLRNTNWVVEPAKVSLMGEAYKRALDINDRIAQEHGLNLFGSQWRAWDRIRHRLEPHENMFPGLENMPAMSKEQLAEVNAEHAASGHKNYGKVDEQGRLVRNVPEEERGGVYQLQPTRPRVNPARFGYFGIPLGAIGAAVAARQGNDQ